MGYEMMQNVKESIEFFCLKLRGKTVPTAHFALNKVEGSSF